MKAARIVKIAVVVIVIAVGVVVAPWWFEEGTAARWKVQVAILHFAAVRDALGSACSEGRFQSVTKLSDVGVAETEPRSFVLRTELQRLASDRTRISAVLPEIKIGGPFPSIAVPYGSTIAFEYVCSPSKVFSEQFVSATVPSRYLPGQMRKQ